MRFRSLRPLTLACLSIWGLNVASSALRADEKTDAERLPGIWLFDSATMRATSELSRVWTSKLVITGASFSLSKFMDLSKDITGKVILNPAATPKTVDLKLEEFNFLSAGAPFLAKIPVCTLRGIYKLDGDRITVCLSIEPDGPRPAGFEAIGDKIGRMTLAKAPPAFKDFPKEVVVSVSGPDHNPVEGANVTGFMYRDPKKQNTEWQYFPPLTTGADGYAKMKYEELRFNSVVARDTANKRMAIASVSPASLANGELSLDLVPECRLSGTIVCEEMKEAGVPMPWTNVYAIKDGRRIASYASKKGDFEFVMPPGSYTLHAYGENLKGRNVPVIVPADRSEHALDPIALTASNFTRLQGKQAPELAGVVAWKGQPVKLADLKGKFVLLEFWGYWCGPCVASMPVLMEMHEKYGDKGLAIIGVHVDSDGDVDTVAKLDEKIAIYKNGIWKGKDLPFPIALTSGVAVGEGDAKSRGQTAGQYGILSYPTTILIGPDGKVIGKFHASDAKSAAEQIEKLLNARKGG